MLPFLYCLIFSSLAQSSIEVPTIAQDADKLCDVREGQTASTVNGVRSGALITHPCSLGVLAGTRVAAICEGKVHGIQWNRIYTDLYLTDRTGVGPLSSALSEIPMLRGLLTEAGWASGGLMEDAEAASSDLQELWIKGTESRTLLLTTMQVEGQPVIRLSLITSYKNACLSGL